MRELISISLAVVAASAGDQAIQAARGWLVQAAFQTGDKPQALQLINRALGSLQGVLARKPNDRMAQLQQGIAIGYKAQLERSIGDAKRARDLLGGLAQRYPNDPETQIAFGGWHCSAIGDVGGFMGGSVLGASRSTGLAALDKAVRLGGDHAFYPAYAGLMRLRLNSGDAAALSLLDRAARAGVSTELDRITQASAKRVAAQARAGDAKGASALAKRLLPFGRIT